MNEIVINILDSKGRWVVV